MKLTTEPGALAGAVRFAARALTARTAYPILSGLKITADPGGSVEVSAFDYETSARARAERRGERAGHRAGAGPAAGRDHRPAAPPARRPGRGRHGPGPGLRQHPVPAAPAAAGHLPGNCPSWPTRPGTPTRPSSPPRSARW